MSTMAISLDDGHEIHSFISLADSTKEVATKDRILSISRSAYDTSGRFHMEYLSISMRSRDDAKRLRSVIQDILADWPEDEEREEDPSRRFDEAQVGGAFDGFAVSSDADPGL